SLVVADAGVDEDRVTRRLHHVRLDARGEIAGPLVDEVRLDPAMVAGDDIGARPGQHGGGRKRRAVDLDHAYTRLLAELHRLHRGSSPVCEFTSLSREGSGREMS